MLSYEEVKRLANIFILRGIEFHPFFRFRIRSKSYAKSAMFQILEMVEEEKNAYGPNIDILKVINSFIRMMDRFIKIKFTPVFNTERRTAVEFKQYLLKEKESSI